MSDLQIPILQAPETSSLIPSTNSHTRKESPLLHQEKQAGTDNSKEIVKSDPNALHHYVATTVETALGREMPQMEVRFENLSLAAEFIVDASADSSKPQLPTIANELKGGVAGMFAKKKIVRKEILKSVSGVFKPGTMTLVLGQPGSGKSSLMKILSGRFPVEKNIKVDGDITYNGKSQAELLKRLPQFVSYTTQDDKHHPTLTVRETLEFAHKFSGGELQRREEQLLANGTPEENKDAVEAARTMFKHYPEVVIEQLGLQNCQNTIVGDEQLRGISGGERKRVTTGEMQFGMKYVTLMDEISTGLDSAATYDIINTQRSIAKTLRKTVVIALLQPSPEVFALFDDVMILNDGEVMYHGPREQVVDYFEGVGFACPPERDVADFLLDLGTNEQRKYENWTFRGDSASLPRLPSEFAEVFRRSGVHQEMLRELAAPLEPDLVDHVVPLHMDSMPEFHQSFWEGAWTVTKRETLVLMRNKPFLIGRATMIVLMALLNSWTFYQFDSTNVQVVLGIIFMALVFMSLGQMSLIPTFMAGREIFYKQRSANFYRASSYVLASSLSQIPIQLIETIIFGSIVYWMCGFTSSTNSFFIFEAILLLTNMAFSAWFFFVASASPNMLVADPLATFTVLIFILFAGFVALKSQFPNFLIWLYWLSPYSWSIRAIAVNEYRSSKHDVCTFKGVNYCEQFNNVTMGEYNLDLFDFQSEEKWVVYALIYLAAAYLVFMCLSAFVLENVRFETPENVSIPSDNDGEPATYVVVETPKYSSGTPRSTYPKDEAVVAVSALGLNFVPVTVAFQDVWYSVPAPHSSKEYTALLKGVSGYALPGTMTALMGASGAGKTTLMDVIAGRKAGGKTEGKILLNGYKATDLAIQRCTGYCEQMDIHSDSATFREALTFSAFLRQDSSVPDSKKYDSVNECLDLLGMHTIADQIIRGSAAEKMKRLTIGVELAAQPSVLFLDEPTSGLDARSAKLIMDGVRKVANTGRTIVCTIHQPSSEVFCLFDNLLLLKRGGETVYFGDLGKDCRSLVDYFEAIPGVSSLPRGGNPASWMLDCIGAGVNNDVTNAAEFVRFFNRSEQKCLLGNMLMKHGVGLPLPGMSDLAFSSKRAASSFAQMKFVTKRFFSLYWRTPDYNLTRIALALVFALLFGLVFMEADYKTFQGINSGVGMLALVMIFMGLISFDAIIPISGMERGSFYRERASQTYNVFWYFVGSTVAELPYVLFTGLVFTAVFFPMVGFTGFTTGVLFWLNMSLVILYHAYFGQLLAFALPSAEVAIIVGFLFTAVFFLFMGYSPPASAIPSELRWLYHITPHRYALSIFVALVFADCPSNATFNSSVDDFVDTGSELGCQPLTHAPVSLGKLTVKQFIEQVFEMKHEDILTNFVAVIGITMLFRLLGLLCLRFVNYKKN